MAVLGVGNANHVFSMVPTLGPLKPAALLPTITDKDKVILNNVQKVIEFLTVLEFQLFSVVYSGFQNISQVIHELILLLPRLFVKVLPDVLGQLTSQVLARLI